MKDKCYFAYALGFDVSQIILIYAILIKILITEIDM